ncbi:MAG: Glycogen synthase [Chlamydiae bacterium]|nr:Glycogen synthase [Chlamydiota bacterium]
MRIVHVAAELAPIAKVGGLADVLLGLSRALSEKKHDVEIILPKYDCLDLKAIENLQVAVHDLPTFFAGKSHHNTIWQGRVGGIKTTFIESHDLNNFFARKTIYGAPDDPARFSYFCRAALEYLLKCRQKIDILHLHDWHTAMVALLYQDLYQPQGLKCSKVMFTIHNLAYEGVCKREILTQAGLSTRRFELIKDENQPRSINLLKCGIVCADTITTVSPNYAKEILDPKENGFLNKVVTRWKKKFIGVLNGIDYTYWNPENDPHLPFHYSANNVSQALKIKKKLKAHLRQTLSLADEECPIVCAITRLVPQKGPELIKQAIFRTLEKGGQFVLLGSALDPKTHEEFYKLKRKLAGSDHVHLELTYNEPLSHLVYAASDLFLVPSIFEPCGLTPMVAMRYGTIPLVRKTGGLIDIIRDEENGFAFGPPTTEGIYSALDRALGCWFNHPQKWKRIVETGMQQDWSWNQPAEEYLKIYHENSVAVTEFS